MGLVSINPANGELIKEYRVWGPGEISDTLDRVHNAWISWRSTSFGERSRLMGELASVLRSERDELARMITLEMGKPIGEARGEIDKCAAACDYYAQNAESFLRQEMIDSDASKSYVRFDPLGIVLAVMPWNFPFWQVFRFAVPALMAGNTAVLKHASNTTWSALSIEGLFGKAGFPENIFRTLLIGSDLVSSVINDRRVAAVTLTGSEAAGRAVASEAGRALKKTVLELGGSDPFIILEDADLEGAVELGVKSRMINSGQSCIAAKRFIVEKSITDDFTGRFKTAVESLVVGDPMSEETNVGPLARPDLRDALHRQVKESIERGARLITGGEPVEGPGAFYKPTILIGVKPGMPAFDEELFGPVAAIIEADDADDALRLANMSDYGLGACIWSSNTGRAEEIAAHVEAGAVFINGFVKSDPRLPFGGVKQSGYGRELSVYGIKEFMNIKTVWVG